MKYLPLLLIFIACHTKQPPILHEKTNDSDVLKPPEGYDNQQVQRHQRAADSLESVRQAAASPVKCVKVTGVVETTKTSYTASMTWTASSNKYYVYKNGVFDGMVNTNSYTATGLKPGTTYQFAVAGFARNKQCERSAPVNITTIDVINPPPTPEPTGNQVIFLQFEPCSVSGSQWSASTITSPGSGLTEDQKIEIFEWTKTMYAAHPKILFTMNQTTYDSADPQHRQMTVFTTNSQWYGVAGGVSFVGSFNTGQPNWVFTQLLNFSARNCKIAGAHEMGHSLGLYHGVDSCGQSYGGLLICSDGVPRAKIMGGNYSDYQHYFQTPNRCFAWGVPCLQQTQCTRPDEDAIIESHLR